MSYPRVCFARTTAKAVLPCLVVLLFGVSTAGQSSNNNYIFLLASGFLCDPADSSTCPATVMASHGQSYEMSGAGSFDAQNKSAKAAGTFIYKSPNGNVLETGVWVASELVSFDSYGVAPAALLRQGSAFGPSPFGHRRLPMAFGPMPTGGLAVMRIRLLPMWGPPRNAVLQVNCALGKVPEERQTEGIRLTLEGGGDDFDQEISGRTMFVLTRPGANPAPKPPDAEAEPNPAPAEVQQ